MTTHLLSVGRDTRPPLSSTIARLVHRPAEVQAVRQALGEVCAALDPASVPLPEVGALWSSLDAIERLASAG